MDTLLLTRLQFGLTSSFFLLFPAITLVLGWILVILRERFAATGDMRCMQVFRFWVPVFSLATAFGGVAGVVMLLDFHGSWPLFFDRMSAAVQPMLIKSGVAFLILNAALHGVLLFGFGRVPGWVHRLSVLSVALGTSLSVLWLIVLEAWMQSPTDLVLQEGALRASATPSAFFVPEVAKMMRNFALISGVTVGALMSGLSTWRWFIGDRAQDVSLSLRLGLILGAVSSALLIVAADLGNWTVSIPVAGSLILAVSLLVMGLSFGALTRTSGGDKGLEGVPRWMIGALIAASFAGWAIIVPGWLSTGVLDRFWLVEGVLSVVEARTVVPSSAAYWSLAAYAAFSLLLVGLFVLSLFRLANMAAVSRSDMVLGRPRARLMLSA